MAAKLAFLICIASAVSCQQHPFAPSQPPPSVPSSDTPLAPNEIIWAGVSGSAPDFIEDSIDRGLGFLELQSKPIRKALIQAGFKIRYEYFSPARISNEFSKNSPICFYPTEWKDPEKTFQTPPDRIYSVGLDFKGEESHSILIRKQDKDRFVKFVGPTGFLKLQSLLKEPSLKTLLPKVDGLGEEFDNLYYKTRDGSVEIKTPYQRQISTRVLRNNNQLIQMLHGGSIDYLLDQFVIREDFKIIPGGEDQFAKLSYENRSIQSLADKQVRITSVTCALNDTTKKAMPFINASIRGLRGAGWSARSASRRSNETNQSIAPYTLLTWRFSPELGSGKADYWASLQLKHFPELKHFTLEGIERSFPIALFGPTQKIPPPPKISQPQPEPTWLLIFTNASSAWILSKADALDLASSAKASFDSNLVLLPQPACMRSQARAWSSEDLRLLRTLRERSFEGVIAGTFESVAHQLSLRLKAIHAFSLLARGLSSHQIQEIRPLLQRGNLKKLELVSASSKVIQEITPFFPSQLEELNLWGSNLFLDRHGDFSRMIGRLPDLRRINLSCTSLRSEDFFNSLMALSSQITSLQAGHQHVVWTPERATQFGKKVFPQLKTLDLELSSLDDRHCGLFGIVPNKLQELRLNGNQLTSLCLQKLFSKSFPDLHTLEIASTKISTLAGVQLNLPPGIHSLDLSDVLHANTLSHLKLPLRLKSFEGRNSELGTGQLEKLARSFDSDMTLLDLAHSKNCDSSVLRILQTSGVSRIKELNLSGNHIFEKSLDFTGLLKPFKIESLNLANTHLTNRHLIQISKDLNPSLKELYLGNNSISTPGIAYLGESLLEHASALQSLSLNSVLDLEVAGLAPFLPKGLRSLDLSGNGLSDQDLEILIPTLPKTLTSLNLAQSGFGVRGAQMLAKALDQDLFNLLDLDLSTPLPEIGWQWILPSLPPTLKRIALGPTSLSTQGTSLLLSNLPRNLTGLGLNSVQMSTPQMGQWMEALPRGLERVNILGGSNIRETEKSSSSKAKWPESLRFVSNYGALSHSVLQQLIEGLPGGNCEVYTKTKTLTEDLIVDLLKKSNGQFVELSRTQVTPPVIQALNLKQPYILAMHGTSFSKGTLSLLSPRALQFLKALAFIGAVGPTGEIIQLLKALPPHLYGIDLQGTQLSLADVDTLITALPEGVHFLSLTGTGISPKGIEKLKEHYKRIEEKTGFKTLLLTE